MPCVDETVLAHVDGILSSNPFVVHFRSRQGSARAGRHHNALTTHDLLLHRGGAGRPLVPDHRPPLGDGEQTATRQALAQSRTHLQDHRLKTQRFTYHRSPLLPRLIRPVL